VTPAAGSPPVFVASGQSGRCRLVVEGKKGASGLDPASQTHPTYPYAADGRPDLQIEASNPLGNGNPAVDCFTRPNSDGIPPIEPPDFGPGDAITSALQDFSCRFFGNSLSASCLMTSDSSAVLGKASAFPTVQYCDDVGLGQAFPVGSTVLTVRLRDSAGNIGPPYQIVVQVPAQ
jgi:hypothetical protein